MTTTATLDTRRTIAYFSMEIGLESGMPTFAGGLGILAGDTIRSAADLKVPMVAVSLLHRKGYFYQRLDAAGNQSEQPVEWAVEDYLAELPARASLSIEGRTVTVRAWKYDVAGCGGFGIPVLFLDTDVPENSDWDRTLTHYLYGGDSRYRLCQEAVLGVGGLRMLRALGFDGLERFHLNEGHASLLALELLDEERHRRGGGPIKHEYVDTVRRQCVFTTHTPVPAGHDQFPMELVRAVLGEQDVYSMPDVFCCEGRLNMTYLALNLCHYVNGVAKKHGEVSRHLFANYTIDSITNGVHAGTWTCEPIRQLFDRHIPGWREDNFSLRYALGIPKQELWDAHWEAKRELVRYVNRETNAGMEVFVLTLGAARRATPYKRLDLVLQDVARLKTVAEAQGRLQIVFAGKAHPEDQQGKEMIRHIFQVRDQLGKDVRIAYLENYDIEIGKLATSGVDVWLNTPQPPLEASGTSGMKAALNGVPSLSVLDGWWIEGCIEGVTGWPIGADGRVPQVADDPARHAQLLYDTLESTVLPLYYQRRDAFVEVMRHAIALNGSFFNTHRMMQQYVLKAYFG